MKEEALRFDPEVFEIKSFEADDRKIVFRAYEGLSYCTNPKSPVQKMNIYVPEIYFEGGEINEYTLKTAPIFMPNTVGGYMEGPAMTVGTDRFGHKPNSAFEALYHGYVVAAPGIRGRNSGQTSREFFAEGPKDDASEISVRCGKAPALIVDMKAAIRYLRKNRDLIPGDTEKIITSGTSAGGALSSLAGATGNSPDYKLYLKEIGAAEERDDVFIANCYCPIIDLEHADMAYEWLFSGEDTFKRMRLVKDEDGLRPEEEIGRMTEEQIRMAEELKRNFTGYLNSLELKNEAGEEMTLDEEGNGSFRDQVKAFVLASAKREYFFHDTAKRQIGVAGSEIESQDYLISENGFYKDLDWAGYVKKITRMKTTPAFDSLDLSSPENDEFGSETVEARHFTAFSKEHSKSEAPLAEDELVKLLNPLRYIRDEAADKAPHWRIRHGAFDRDTAIAVPVILALLLKGEGLDVDFRLPWGVPHSGDYDLPRLFEYIDEKCR